MREIRSEIEIDAPPERVWEILSDFPAYPEWNPFVRRISGEQRVGARLEVRLEPPGSSGITMRPRVLTVEPNRELRWAGRLLVPGLFDGEHQFLIEPIGDGRSRFSQNERFTGILPGLVGKTLAATERGFGEMNVALKDRAVA